jgi:hypothetical protein
MAARFPRGRQAGFLFGILKSDDAIHTFFLFHPGPSTSPRVNHALDRYVRLGSAQDDELIKESPISSAGLPIPLKNG